MSPLSAPVLGGAALVSAPALWSSLVEGTASPTYGITRYLISALVCWLALEVVAMLVGPVKPAGPEQAPAPEAQEPKTPAP